MYSVTRTVPAQSDAKDTKRQISLAHIKNIFHEILIPGHLNNTAGRIRASQHYKS
jgi:hypothetical protein